MANAPHGFDYLNLPIHKNVGTARILVCKKCGNAVGDTFQHVKFHHEIEALQLSMKKDNDGKTRTLRRTSGYLPDDLLKGSRGGETPTVHPGEEPSGPTQG